MRSLLKLTSRMIVRCDMLEDEELLALASDVYRNGFYDEVTLNYLMKYRFGPVDETLSIWKSACGFEMDTYDMEEKPLPHQHTLFGSEEWPDNDYTHRFFQAHKTS